MTTNDLSLGLCLGTFGPISTPQHLAQNPVLHGSTIASLGRLAQLFTYTYPGTNCVNESATAIIGLPESPSFMRSRTASCAPGPLHASI